MSEELIRLVENVTSWENISKYQKLSGLFIFEFNDKVHWAYITQYQKLSESFIRELFIRHNNLYIRWVEQISKYQVLSESFIREFADKVDWRDINKTKIIRVIHQRIRRQNRLA